MSDFNEFKGIPFFLVLQKPDAALSPEAKEIKFLSIGDSFATGFMQIITFQLLLCVLEVELLLCCWLTPVISQQKFRAAYLMGI